MGTINLNPMERARLIRRRNKQIRRDLCAFLIFYALTVTVLLAVSARAESDCGPRNERCAVASEWK